MEGTWVHGWAYSGLFSRLNVAIKDNDGVSSETPNLTMDLEILDAEERDGVL